ncbi:DUF6314 family protein [Gymnodinialimonas sp. 2305UL16-5]|uniref:DUF6314 family protein n=1 Tax=Gymnodinialimonas mytili TaxID=3126503 RepID=UPI0030A79971
MISLPDLEGSWELNRRIEDAYGGIQGRFQGRCVWRPDAHGLVQEERGILTYGAAPPMQATRRYLWRQDGEDLVVLFEDRRPFHSLGPGRLQDRHLCDPDTYDVSYDLSAWPTWQQRWCVTGPRKDSMITSIFTPNG